MAEERTVADWWPGTIDPDDPDHDEDCEAEFVGGPNLWTECGCSDRPLGAYPPACEV